MLLAFHRHLRSITIGQAARPCIPLFIRLHAYSQPVIKMTLIISLPCHSLAHLRDLLPMSYITRISSRYSLKQTVPSYLPSFLFPSDLIHWLRMDVDFFCTTCIIRVLYIYYFHNWGT
jgi:hypothetical protein